MSINIKMNFEQKEKYIKKGYWLDKTLNDFWNVAVEKYPNHEYIVDDKGLRCTYAELDKEASKLANYFKSIGIKAKDTISFQIPIWSEFAIITIACFKLGAIAHPVAMSYEKKELITALKLTQPKAFLCPTFFYKTNYEKLIDEVLPDVETLKSIVLLDNVKEKTINFPTLKEILRIIEPLKKENNYKGTGEDIAVILGTSGTTSGSKGVLLTHNNIRFSEEVFSKELGLTSDDIIFMPAPLNHATGFHHGIIAPFLIGSKVVLQQKYVCSDSIDIMNKEKCTYSMGATPFIYDILKELDENKKEIPSLKFYLCGGAPVPGYMVEKASRHKILLCEVYGSTESVPHIFVRPSEAAFLNGTTSGRTIEGIEIRVVDEDGDDVPFGVQGEELSRGPNVFVGYLNNKEITDEVLDDEGWFHSGDLCTMDENGNVRIIGRKKDMIVRGGENLDSNSINNNIEGCEGVREHTIIGIPDNRLGERICVFVSPKKGFNDITLSDIVEYLKKNEVSKRFWPEHLEVIDEIPYTASGKVKKYLLLEEYNRRLKENANE